MGSDEQSSGVGTWAAYGRGRPGSQMDKLQLNVSALKVDRIQLASFRQIDAYYQWRAGDYLMEKDRWWKPDFSSLEAYEHSVEPNRHRFIEMMGGWPLAPAALARVFDSGRLHAANRPTWGVDFRRPQNPALSHASRCSIAVKPPALDAGKT